MADKTLTADEVLDVSIDLGSIRDREGNVASVENVTWATSDETVASVDVAEDGLSAVVVSHLAGTARIMVEADADLGDGVRPINGSIEVEVTAGSAVSITVNAGDARPKDATPPEPPADTTTGGTGEDTTGGGAQP